jgi:hypothetical protein
MKTKIKTQEYSRGMIKIITCQNLKIVFHENLVSKSKKKQNRSLKKRRQSQSMEAVLPAGGQT